jgi:Uma2 family endonuclease
MNATLVKSREYQQGEPILELVDYFPEQGRWSESAYLALHTSRLVEYDDGMLAFPPVPTLSHQDIVLFLFGLLQNFVLAKGLGKVYVAPLRVRLWTRKYREPDIVFLSQARLDQTKDDYPTGADLVMEVVSGSGIDRERDLVVKRREYAEAGISEYWIVDPQEEQIIVCHLAGELYEEAGVYGPGEQAASVTLAGFGVAVTAVFAAANS